MENWLIPALGIIFVFGFPTLAILIVAYRNQQAKHDERIAMIEKGIVIEEPEKKANKYNALRNGLLMIGLAVGALAGMFSEGRLSAWEDGFLVFITSILGGGIGFIVYFFIARKMEREEKKEV